MNKFKEMLTITEESMNDDIEIANVIEDKIEEAIKKVQTLEKKYKDPKSKKYLGNVKTHLGKAAIELDNFSEYEFGKDY